MSAAQTAPAWADLYMACLTLDRDGDVRGINLDQWRALNELRATLGEPFPMEVARLTRPNSPVGAWLRNGVRLLRGEQVAVLLSCDIAERVLPVFEAACPNDTRPREAIRVGRAYAIGHATEEEAETAADAAESAGDPNEMPYEASSAADSASNLIISPFHAAISAAHARNEDGMSDECRWQTERTALYVAGVLP